MLSKENIEVSSTRLLNLQAVRGFAVVIVVLFHSAVIDQLYFGGNYVPTMYNLGSVGVDIFFVLSGFIILSTSHRHQGEILYVPIFLIRRFIRIVPLYWTITAIVFIFAVFQPGMVNSDYGNKIDPLASFLLAPSPVLPLVPVGWTLVFEAHFYMLFALLLCLPKRCLLWGILMVGSAVITLNLFGGFSQASSGPYANLVSSPFVLEFLAGCLLGLAFVSVKPKPFGKAALLLALIGFVVGGWLYEANQPGVHYDGWLRVLTFLGPSLLLIYGAVALEKEKGLVAGRFCTLLGDASYSIYLIHLLLMHIVGRFIWPRIEPLLGSVAEPMVLIGMTIAAFVAGCVCYYVIEKPMQRRLNNCAVALVQSPRVVGRVVS
jgi:exopolysaccharide production protein ExoZ